MHSRLNPSVRFYRRYNDKFNRVIQWQLCRRERGACVAAALAQHGCEEVRSAVKHPGGIVPARSASDMAFNAHKLLQPVETSECDLDLRQHVQCGEARSGTAIRFRKLRTDSAGILRRAMFDWELRG